MEAFVLVQTEVGKAALVAGSIAALSGVRSAEDVVGPYDVIARVAGASDDELGEVIHAIQQVGGITRTLTCQIPNHRVSAPIE
ncbi:Lrp/AsnC ligand binding domain-containing protein [Aldersonia sp. NBC_00410]|uniref:Lrp/AsnC ligand binding domain-containing protein n=1 Tax=Aldersonia sp. NBC_00410 TaxID=2975954 RepID=UPI00225593E2|nr:Lrp/AsnC ligand binding domain-containing protein [Aldersonia sp. NBC_00410]MCX5046142.1 Lrp/AsnC ligand binding domain-containing protein [Aldersonia sp. NBC_00410]